MAAGNFKWYVNALYLHMKGDLDLDSGLRAILVTSSYIPAQTTDDQYDDVSANEVSGTGYTTYGKALTTIAVSKSGSDAIIDFDDLTWTSSTITAKYLVIVKDANADGTLVAGDYLVGYLDLDTGGGSVSSTSADFTVAVNASGALKITAS